ncbi:hypothetical protein J3R30DRAFT_3400220 [Lentinula aciculospora]|uniref:Phosphopyruvate hydratase n=1 Tax=Lentinula aciculospora TaxID=153920 RepID=A0A9W9AX83_9AGAR|nr:hypothetical protein J3R30DRAFT_3400220 [Lentinula aciculospora]
MTRLVLHNRKFYVGPMSMQMSLQHLPETSNTKAGWSDYKRYSTGINAHGKQHLSLQGERTQQSKSKKGEKALACLTLASGFSPAVSCCPPPAGKVSKSGISETGRADKYDPFDGSPNKNKPDADATLGVPTAVAAATAGKGVPLYVHLTELVCVKPPYVFPYQAENIINGGSHAGKNLAFLDLGIVVTYGTNKVEVYLKCANYLPSVTLTRINSQK